MAKAIANSYPLSLGSAVKEVPTAINSWPHPIATFGGNPVSCTALLATLQTRNREHLVLNTQNTSKHLLQLLVEYLLLSPRVLEIRGLSLMMSNEFDIADRASWVVQECFVRGLLIGLGDCERHVV